MSGLKVSLRDFFQAENVEFFLRNQTLQFGVLVFEFAESFRFVDADAAVGFAPVVDRLLGDAELSGDLVDAVALAGELVGFGEFPDDLFGVAVPSFLGHLLGSFPALRGGG